MNLLQSKIKTINNSQTSERRGQKRKRSDLRDGVTYALRNNGSDSSTGRTIKPEQGTSVLSRNSLGKRLEVVEQSSLEIKNSPEKGRGLYSNEEIKKGEIIGVYGGTLLTKEEAARLEENQEGAVSDIRVQYLFDFETVVQDGYSQLINEDIKKN